MIKLKEYRQESDLSINKLSQLTGLSRTYIRELEDEDSGYSNPSVKALCSFCRAFKCTPNELIKEEHWKEPL